MSQIKGMKTGLQYFRFNEGRPTLMENHTSGTSQSRRSTSLSRMKKGVGLPPGPSCTIPPLRRRLTQGKFGLPKLLTPRYRLNTWLLRQPHILSRKRMSRRIRGRTKANPTRGSWAPQTHPIRSSGPASDRRKSISAI